MLKWLDVKVQKISSRRKFKSLPFKNLNLINKVSATFTTVFQPITSNIMTDQTTLCCQQIGMAAIFTIYLAQLYLNTLLRITGRADSCHISIRGSLGPLPELFFVSMPELIHCHTHKELPAQILPANITMWQSFSCCQHQMLSLSVWSCVNFFQHLLTHPLPTSPPWIRATSL